MHNEEVIGSDAPPVLVTGATGNVGRAVVAALLEQGAPVRAAVRNGDEAAAWLPPAVDLLRFDFGEPATHAPALRGARALFLMRPPAIADVETYLGPVVEAASDVGVEHVVFLSLMGLETKSYVPHYKVEKMIEASGIPYTFLRPGFFMQNLDTTHRADIVERDELFVPAGNARTAFIDVRDIGAVAAHVLTIAGHEYQAYELTGNRALRYDQVAAIFTDVLGRHITYARPSLPRYAWRMRRRGHPWPYILVSSLLYFATRRGAAERVTDDVRRLLGRDPISMRRYVEDYATAWQVETGQTDKLSQE